MVALFVSSWTVGAGLRGDRLLVCDRIGLRRQLRYRNRSVVVSAQAGGEESTNGDNDAEAASSAAWAAWSRARQKPEDAASRAAPRDPVTEVNFWRAAARESTDGVDSGISADAGAGTGSGDVRSEQRAVWGEAREVTADVEDLKERLADELKQYDPDSALDDYRSVAWEIRNVGGGGGGLSSPPPASAPPPPTPLMYPRAPPGGYAAYGPEVVLDDYDATEELRDPKAETDFWRAAAREVVGDVPQDSDTGASSSTSTSADSGADAEPGRDPKAETDFWRAAAREVVSDVGVSAGDGVANTTSDASNTGKPSDERLENTGVNFMTDGTVFAPRGRVPEAEFWRATAREVGDSNDGEVETISEAPEASLEVLPEVPSEAQPEAEPATARASARSDAGYPPLDGSEGYTMSGPGFSVDESGGSGGGTGASASNLFAAFRAADAQWASSVEIDSDTDTGNGTTRSGKDEASRWRAWEDAKGFSFDDSLERGGLGDETSMWMRAAREVGGGGGGVGEDEQPPAASTSASEATPAGSTDMWASAAREITEGLSAPSASEDEDEDDDDDDDDDDNDSENT